MRWIAALGLLLVAAFPALASERITDFDVTITLGSEDKITVKEVIDVIAEGNAIDHGIYRDIPLQVRNASGQLVRAGFEIISVKREGESEPYHTVSSTDGIRIYIGSADYSVDEGPHRYEITYATTRQIKRLSDFDEITWNVTGNEWVFPIDRASARVILPAGTKPIRQAAYTGVYGATGSDATDEVKGNEVWFQTTRRLDRAEGLTVSVAFPKGVVAVPTGMDAFWLSLDDHRDEVIGGLGIFGVLAFYLFSWVRVGRDPEGGVIIPLFTPTPGLSPVLSHYIWNRGLKGGGWPALSAGLVDLAVKGLVTLDNSGSAMRVVRTEASAPADLSGAEKAVFKKIDGFGVPLIINKDNGPRVQALGTVFRDAVESENRGQFFRNNYGYVAVGVILSLVAILMLIIFGQSGPSILIAFFPVTVVSIIVTAVVVNFAKSTKSGGIFGKIKAAVLLAGVGFFFMSGAIHLFDGANLEMLSGLGDFAIPATVLCALVVINVLFFKLMEAPTVLGRQKLDEIEGLKLYLSVAEADRMNMAGAPQMSPSHYEKLLPYAIALDVEKPWSQAFASWMTAAAAAGAAVAYQPMWFSDNHAGTNLIGSMRDSFSSMSSGFVSALPDPPPSSSDSSSSGGGGYSGGGGGGGGGGGW